MSDDRAARFDALAAELRPTYVARQIPPENDWLDLARRAADDLLIATAPTLRRFARSHVSVAITTALEALARLEAEDGR